MNNGGNGYDVGNVAEIPLTVTNTAFAAVDPDTLTLTVKAPGVEAVTYTFGSDEEVVQAATGSYYLLYPITVSGKHLYRWTGTGDNAGVVQGAFYARPLTF